MGRAYVSTPTPSGPGLGLGFRRQEDYYGGGRSDNISDYDGTSFCNNSKAPPMSLMSQQIQPPMNSYFSSTPSSNRGLGRGRSFAEHGPGIDELGGFSNRGRIINPDFQTSYEAGVYGSDDFEPPERHHHSQPFNAQHYEPSADNFAVRRTPLRGSNYSGGGPNVRKS